MLVSHSLKRSDVNIIVLVNSTIVNVLLYLNLEIQIKVTKLNFTQ